MRGIFLEKQDTTLHSRFNPAYAGNMKLYLSPFFQVMFQPLVCGEYETTDDNIVIPIGSTPRMRGIFVYTCLLLVSIRFNPAYAGNIKNCKGIQKTEKVQPRVCGEYQERLIKYVFWLGSTPRMRGIFYLTNEEIENKRFNPAYAGNMH